MFSSQVFQALSNVTLAYLPIHKLRSNLSFNAVHSLSRKLGWQGLLGAKHYSLFGALKQLQP
jgi:hypothetical protein